MTAKANQRSLRSIMKKIKRGDKLNILTFATHERYEENLCRTGHNFYSLKYGKEWDTTYAPVPDNYHIIDSLPQHIDIDLVLSHTSCNRLQVAHDILTDTNGMSGQSPVPILRHCHVLPDIRFDVETQIQSYNSLPIKHNSFISDYNKTQWKSSGYVVEHGVDTNFWRPSDRKVPEIEGCLSVVNEFPTRDWCCGFQLWKDVVKDIPRFIVGKCTTHPNFSEPARTREELRDYYQRARLFLNTSLHSPVPTVMLEAMACGCPVVSTENCMIPEIIEHGVNGFMANDPNELRNYCIQLLNDPELARKMGAAARETIVSKFSMPRFIDNWNNLLYKTIGEYNEGLLGR